MEVARENLARNLSLLRKIYAVALCHDWGNLVAVAWWLLVLSLAVIMRNLSRLRRNLCDCKEIGHINKCGLIYPFCPRKFVVVAWFLCGVVS